MKPLVPVASVALILAVSLAVLGTRSVWLSKPEEEAAPVPAADAPAASPQAGDETQTPPVRQIAPEIVAMPNLETSSLTRVAPREPLSEFGPPIVEKRDPRTLVYRPLATAAGRIVGQGVEVTIAGIDIVEPGQSCTDADGVEWPCGAGARTAFRNFLRGRALDCALPEDMAVKQATADCLLGQQDVGAWIVANGWGLAAPDGPYVEDERNARAAGLGIFGTAPAPLLNFENLSEPPALSGEAPISGMAPLN